MIREREVVAGYTKEYLRMKSGSGDNSLMFLTLADLLSKPKPFPKIECAGVTLWTKDEYREWLKTENKKVGATDGNLLTYEMKGCCCRKQSSDESAHSYLQNKDGTLVADLSDIVKGFTPLCPTWVVVTG